MLCPDLIGIWSQLEVDNIYPFTKLEKEQMKALRELLKYEDIDNYRLYKYGLYLCTVYSDIKGLSKRKLNKMKSELPILTRSEIKINGRDIATILNKEPGKYIKRYHGRFRKGKILNKEIDNEYDKLKDYIIKTI
ncbi:MAG: hypothetical protein L6V91_09490 [Bacilli bacterium]|nr:MAG: hypothetical protein L6V91_09490 [Bacilli bacterium]